ncbi:hypothetical protein JDV02_001999 [Purpureocillium takamizusanense]|uniref:Uncharacterized protein n=1 Tax=Purpureocillium takamizusanense TaxID=2060973 RepID=A0A9Q8V837_9HYPO|nr:uncharacterized protein JDV02_001999 [Purpureocillium takamizusanense]UNI15469.1 hypothetical protein JDV02_001999 [Purpureocillium takamizusanense]
MVVASDAIHLIRAPQVVLVQSNDQSPNTSAPSSSPDDGSASRGGMSTGAKAAIGTVIPLVFLAMALGAYFLIRRRRRHLNDKNGTQPDQNEEAAAAGQAELDGAGAASASPLSGKAELDTSGQRISELVGSPGTVPGVLEGIQELPGDYGRSPSELGEHGSRAPAPSPRPTEADETVVPAAGQACSDH